MPDKNFETQIKSNNYFSALASRLDLLRQNLNPYTQKEEKAVLKKIVEELKCLQDKYQIMKH